MITLETQTKQFQNQYPMLPGTFSQLPNGVLAAFRNTHLVDDVITPLVAQRDHIQYHGELEAFILEPLLSQAKLVLNKSEYANLKPGFFLQFSQRYATGYALAAEALTVSQTKPMFDAVSSKVMDISPIIQALNSKIANNKDFAKKDAKGNPIPGAYDVIGGLDEIFRQGNVYDAVYQTITTTEISDAAQDFASQLILMGGTGPGLPLPTSVAPARAATLMQISQAIRILINPSLAGANTAKPDVTKFQSDAYAMAVMFSMYLHHSQNADTYNIAFSGQPSSADARVRMPMAIQSARRLAWMYSGVATASQSFDYLSVRALIGSVLEFIKPAQVSQASRIADVEADLNLIDDVLARSIPAPIKAHFDWVYSALERLAGGKTLLPEAFFTSIVPNSPSIPSLQNPEKGWSAIEWGTYVTNQVEMSSLQNIALTISGMVYQLRVNSQSLSTRVNSFLLHNQFDPNTLNVPNALFADPEALKNIRSLGATTYLNPWEPARYSMPIKRFLPGAKGSENVMKWVGQDITYAPTNLPRMRIAQLISEAMVFKPVADVPVRRSIGQKFSLSPIPRQYVSHSLVGSIKNEFESVAQAIKANSVGLNGAFTYFQDAATVCAFGDDDQKSSMVWALSGMMTIYVFPLQPGEEDKSKLADLKFKSSLQMNKLAFPLPYIYGYPTSVFLSKQQYTNGRTFSTLVQGPSGKSARVYFCLHSHTMPVSSYSYYQVPVTYGVLATLPISNVYSASLSQALDDMASTVIQESAQRAQSTLDMYAKIQISDELQINTGDSVTPIPITEWAASLTSYPHIAFSHFSSASETLSLSVEDVVQWAYATVQRTVIPGSSEMLVSSEIEDAYVMFEAKDVYNQDQLFDVTVSDIKDVITASAPDAQQPATTSGQQSNAAPVDVDHVANTDAAQNGAPAATGKIADMEQISLHPSKGANVGQDTEVATFKPTTAARTNVSDAETPHKDGAMLGDVSDEIAAIDEMIKSITDNASLSEEDRAAEILILKKKKRDLLDSTID